MTQQTRTILVVEDDDDSRAMISTVLGFEGHTVVTAANGAEAFNQARRHNPCLILLDLMMPVMTGEEFRSAQLADPALKRIPVVVLSAHHDARAIARRMKAADCLLKPLDIDTLHQVVNVRCRA